MSPIAKVFDGSWLHSSKVSIRKPWRTLRRFIEKRVSYSLSALTNISRGHTHISPCQYTEFLNDCCPRGTHACWKWTTPLTFNKPSQHRFMPHVIRIIHLRVIYLGRGMECLTSFSRTVHRRGGHARIDSNPSRGGHDYGINTHSIMDEHCSSYHCNKMMKKGGDPRNPPII